MVSVIVTTFGANEKLLRAVDSVLAQTYSEIEVVVVDDNNPETPQRVKTEYMMLKYANDERVQYIKHHRNRNGSAARNTGIQVAKGDYISLLDDDDYYLPERIECALFVMNQNSSLDGVCFEVVKTKSRYITEVMHVDDGHILTPEDMLVARTPLGSGSNIFLKKEIIHAVNGFDEEFNRKQDIEFMLRVVEKGKVAYVHDFQIVKDVSGVRKLNYNNNKEALSVFNRKFDKELLSLSEKKRNEYYISQYRFLFNIAKQSGEREFIEEAIFNLVKFDPKMKMSLSSIDRIVLISKMYNWVESSFIDLFLKFLKACRYKKIDLQLRKYISDDKYKIVRDLSY